MAELAIKSDVSGVVVSVSVSQNETVSKDDEIAVIESMKMEIPITAENSGIVAEVLVEAGDAVEEGQSLVILK